MAKQRTAVEFTPAQKKVVQYFGNLCKTDPGAAAEELGRIIHMRADGAVIVGTELARVYDRLGYFGREEVSKTTWDFCDELTGMYKRVWK